MTMAGESSEVNDMGSTKWRNTKRNFILQLGVTPPDDPESEAMLYSALQFQPRVVGGLTLAAAALQSPEIFFLLGAALLWSAVAPRWNPFNGVYNSTLGKRRVALLPSPTPRK